MKRIYSVIILLIPLLGWGGNMLTYESVLATGTWHKLAVQQTGIHRVTYDDMVVLGMDPASIVPANIRVYGNGGGMLPEANDQPRIDDLLENSIVVYDGDDGSFDPGDYFIFYGESPDVWLFDPMDKTFTHEKNLYSDFTYYFITTDLGPGKRVQPVASLDTTPGYTSIRFTDYAFHELDERNLIRSGKIWVGEEFNESKPAWEFQFYFPNVITTTATRINTFAVARAPTVSTMYIFNEGDLIDQFTMDYSDPQSTSIYARPKLRGSATTLKQELTTIRLEFNLPTPGSLAWLNYIEVIAQRFLKWVGPQFSFRDHNTIHEDKNTLFRITGSPENMVVWDVTDPGAIGSMQGTWNPTTGFFDFILPTPVLKEFIAFDGSGYYPVTPIGPVANQNLHGLNPATLIIVSHPLFMEQAERLAEFHRNETKISVIVAETEQVFQEFSSGQPDLTAIRDFVRMLYLRATESDTPRYILLFGDGSYDYKDRIPNNTNFVPTFESYESFKFISTYVTDDYFGIMGENSGQGSVGALELGMGRFPVSDLEQAEAIVDKIIHYAQKNDTIQSSWRNTLTFIADDEDSNLHLHQAEELCDIVASKYPVYNVNKIYLDAYQLVKTPSGPRYPSVNIAINNAVNNGNLIINYTGHGGEDAWSEEKVLTIPDIESWTNPDKLPVFITATCEFSRFDNPERFSAGEMVIVKPKAGAIAIYTTTRLALATANFKLDTSFFHNLMNRDEDGNYMKMGDLLRISKNNNNNNNNIRNFVLLGDPAQPIAFPEYRVVTTAINGEPVGVTPDTLLGLAVVTVSGEILDQAGNKATGFNGILEAKVFDKPVTYRTLANQSKSYKEYFQIQNELLSDGPASIENGTFSFSFIVPREISPYFGFGKISYYACSETSDGNGYDDNVVIGGKDPSVIPDNEGPEISVYLNSRSFISGGQVDRNPLLMVDLFDEDGINHVGLGLGHEIIAAMDDNWSQAVVLNSYYTPALNDFQQGTALYPYAGLSIGRHTLTVRAWDMFNNSSESTIDFYVFEHPVIHVTSVYTFPNPLIDGTTFTFRPEAGNGSMDVAIEVYTVTGQPVRVINTTVTENTGQPVQVYWDGTNQNGMKLSSGIYPYRVKFMGANGSFAHTSGKVIILR
ncbi:MAG: type IX secretion system sortase PorU [Bacteroidales bacterium]|nr:type IX secretion system sortase PorU [Bacteroidales bacterium]